MSGIGIVTRFVSPRRAVSGAECVHAASRFPLVPTFFQLALVPMNAFRCPSTPIAAVQPGISTCANLLDPESYAPIDADWRRCRYQHLAKVGRLTQVHIHPLAVSPYFATRPAAKTGRFTNRETTRWLAYSHRQTRTGRVTLASGAGERPGC